uniref:Uncharacterized protein n=1 Tax=Arundo donax TaxID=35708 RepID=A0A0A9C5G8_ARUDO
MFPDKWQRRLEGYQSILVQTKVTRLDIGCHLTLQWYSGPYVHTVRSDFCFTDRTFWSAVIAVVKTSLHSRSMRRLFPRDFYPLHLIIRDFHNICFIANNMLSPINGSSTLSLLLKGGTWIQNQLFMPHKRMNM